MVEDDPFVARYARRIRSARAALDLSQDEFAARVGVSKRTIRAWEHGMNMPQAEHRCKLQVIFDEVDAEEEKQKAAIGI